MGTPPPATRRTVLATRYPLPTTRPGTPNFSVPDLALAESKFKMTAKKTHSCNDKVNTIYSFIQIGRESSLCKSEGCKTSASSLKTLVNSKLD